MAGGLGAGLGGLGSASFGAAGAFFQNTLGSKLPAATQTRTDATLTADDTFLFNVLAGRKYIFELTYIFNIVTQADSFQMDFNSGNATMTNFSVGTIVDDGGVGIGLTNALSQALATVISITTVPTNNLFMVTCYGGFVVNAAGTFGPRWSKKAAGAAANLVRQIGSGMNIQDAP